MANRKFDPEVDVEPLTSCPAFAVDGWDDVVATLRSKDIVHSAAILAGAHRDPEPGGQGEVCLREFIGNALTFSNGDSHRTRRRVLNQLVRPAALDVFRDEVIAPEAAALLPRVIHGPGEDGKYRLDLIKFCDRVFLHFAAKFIGLVDIDTDERMERLRECVTPLSNAVTSVFYKDRAAIIAQALEAKDQYLKEFYLPSLEAQREWRAGTDGRIPDDLPMNFLQLVLEGSDPQYADQDLAIRDSVILFVGSVASSTMAIVNTVADLAGWFAEHPEDHERRTDYGFLFDALQESLRLRSPFSPYVFRMARRDTSIGGEPVQEGQELHVSIPRADRDPSVWGPDAARFNPRREVPEDVRRYGIAFGVGEHLCLGQRVVMGSDGTGGSHVRVLQLLYAAGVRPDPDNPPAVIERADTGAKSDGLDLPRWYDFPAVLEDWTPAQAEAARP
ncbi:cytochrome P450 [Sporichthya sp.]|uniref:cytochrome P450 n=1 Tax=Sporichthya sp. TaxID=65475 RepID=UPI001796E8C0|nr:cytochrome P450 [Sporichthya sp.]MBA3741438.1 cytochrome P450 [Sporichthya sp.]